MRLAICFLFVLLGTGTARAALTINEIRIDQPGTDTSEYFELYANGMNFADLSSYWYLVIGDGTGGSGVLESVTQLSGSLNAGQFYLAAESTFALTGTANLTTNLNFENSDNVTHLLVQGFSGASGDDLDTNDDGILDLTPWSSVLDAVSLVQTTNVPANGDYYYATALGGSNVGPDGAFVPGHVYREIDGTGAFLIGPFDPVGGKDTPGRSNVAVPEPSSLSLFTSLGATLLVRRNRKA